MDCTFNFKIVVFRCCSAIQVDFYTGSDRSNSVILFKVVICECNSRVLLNISSYIQFLYSFFRYKGHRTEDMNIESAIITSDDYVLSGSVTGELWCWDLVSGEVVKKLMHFPRKVLCSLSVHPKNNSVLTASMHTIRLWDTEEEVEASSMET